MEHIVAIIPTYNEEEILPFCLNHLRNNQIDNIVVLDNESTDNTARIALQHGVKVMSFSSGGLYSEEDINKNVKKVIGDLPSHIDWIFKVDADEFLYSHRQGETLKEFVERVNSSGFNCIGSFSHQTYPMTEEIQELERSFDPLNILKHVIPHIINMKYSLHDHEHYRCIWKVSTFHKSLSYRNPHYLDGAMRLSPELLLLRHIPYVNTRISRKRLIEGRKRRTSRRNFEIMLGTHYNDIPDSFDFVFDHLRQICFNWDILYKGYQHDFDHTLKRTIGKLGNVHWNPFT